MPQSAKSTQPLEERSALGEPMAGARDEGAEPGQHPAYAAAVRPGGGNAQQGAEGDLPDMLDHGDLDEFANSVMSGLTQAGLEIEADLPTEPQPMDDDATLQESSEAFFADWGDGLTEVAEGQSATTGESSLHGNRTLSEIGMASAAGYTSAFDRVSRKHDELADAVQSALLSVYGDGQTDAGTLVSEHGSSNKFGGSNAAQNGRGMRGSAADDSLSPQEVILNYFSYDPGARNANGNTDFNASHYAFDNDETTPEYRSGSQPAAQRHYSAHRQAQWENISHQAGPYSGQVPVPFTPSATSKPSPQGTERENSRLLGAAAIGLVGGIAIAATLAVFLINSYGPDFHPVPGEYRNTEGADPGYGYATRSPEPIDAKKNAAASVPPEIVAADVVATAGQPSPLAITVKSQLPPDQVLVSITGVPEGARLNAGVDAGGGNWLLQPQRLSALTINLPLGTTGVIPLEVQLLDGNGKTSLTEKKQFLVRLPAASADANGPAANTQSMVQTFPAPSPPQGETRPPSSSETRAVTADPPATQAPPPESGFKTQTVAATEPQPVAMPPFQTSVAPSSAAPPAPETSAADDAAARRASLQPEIADLIREGNKHMREGDILEARRLYQKAVLLGDPEAALAMGRSYDPIYFARIEKKNAEPDPAKAFDWYRKAMDGGATQTARVRIENLKHFLNE